MMCHYGDALVRRDWHRTCEFGRHAGRARSLDGFSNHRPISKTKLHVAVNAWTSQRQLDL